MTTQRITAKDRAKWLARKDTQVYQPFVSFCDWMASSNFIRYQYKSTKTAAINAVIRAERKGNK